MGRLIMVDCFPPTTPGDVGNRRVAKAEPGPARPQPRRPRDRGVRVRQMLPPGAEFAVRLDGNLARIQA
jgi:hypothetical protein